VYRCAKQYSEPASGKRGDKRGTKADELHLTPLELIDRIAAVVPPPRTHRHRYLRAAHYPCAVLIARIYEVFPLLCPLCGGQMRIIAFITHSADIRHILWVAVGGCARGGCAAHSLGASSLLGCCGRSNCRFQRGQIAQKPCHTWNHAFEFPIRAN